MNSLADCDLDAIAVMQTKCSIKEYLLIHIIFWIMSVADSVCDMLISQNI